jgi:leucyl-tRNA synthetase
MAFQGTFSTFMPRNQVNQLVEVRRADLIRTKIKVPFVIHPEVYVLPMESVLATKVHYIHSYSEIHSYALIPQGTGVVTSIPSDSPDDFQTLVDLCKKPEFYNVDHTNIR